MLENREKEYGRFPGINDLYDDYLYEVIDEYYPGHNFVFIKPLAKVQERDGIS